MTLTHVNSQGVKDNSLVNADVATNAAILASKLSHTQSQTGAVARTLANRFADSLSVTDFGALGNNNENSATTNRAAIQAALDAASGSKAVFLPVGTYYVDDTIVIPSHTYFVGQGEKSVIKMKSDVGRNTTLVRTGKRDDKKKHITIEHMTLDSNRARWSVSGGTVLTDPRIHEGSDTATGTHSSTLTYYVDNGGHNNQSVEAGCLVICFSEHVLINNVRCLDAYKHCFDITSPKYRRGQENNGSSVVPSGRRCQYDTVVRTGTSSQSGYVITVSLTGHGFDVDDYVILDLPNTARDMTYRVDSVVNANSFTVRSETSSSDSGNCTITQDQGSRFVTLRNCYARGAGDDNITTHFSSDLLIEGCVSERTSGVLIPTNCNSYEIDDGSRNVTLKNCTGIECVKGLQIKGHTYAPAPYNIVVDGLRVVNCCQGVDIRHTGYEDVARSQSGSVPQGERGSGTYLGGGRVRTADGNSNLFDYTGVSPTGRNISLANIQIIAPRVKIPLLTTGLPDTDTSNHYDTLYGVRLTAFENVQITNMIISDGRLDAAQDYRPRETTAGDYQALFRVMYGARNVKIQNLAVYGFDDIDESLHVSESVIGPVVIDGYTSINGPKTAARITGASQNYHGCLNNYHFFRDANTRIDSNSSGTAIGTGDYGIYCTVNDFHIGEGDIIGYTNNYYSYGAYSLGRTLPAISLYNPKNTDVSGNPDYTYGTSGSLVNGENINFLNVQYNHGGFDLTSGQDRVTIPSHGLYMVLAAIGGSRTGGGSSSDTNAVLLDLVRTRSGSESNAPGTGTNVMFSTGASDGEEWFVTMAHVVQCEKGDYLNLELNSLETGGTALHQGVIDRGYFHVHKVG